MKQKFKVGQVLNFYWNSAYSNIIRINNWIEYGNFKKNKWSHSAIIGEIKGNDIIVYEALKDGFVKNPYTIRQLNIWVEDRDSIYFF